MRFYYLFFFLILVGCTSSHDSFGGWEAFSGRSPNRTLIYRASVPQGWERVDPENETFLWDTTHPIVSFCRDDVTLTIHNFPVATLDARIPPEAQIERWAQQLPSLDPESLHVQPEAHGGFVGLFFSAKGEGKGVIAWTLQLDARHFATLREEDSNLRADVTLKAVGPYIQLEAYKDEITQIARSFELIEEIPHP